jgi:hypothetical protein
MSAQATELNAKIKNKFIKKPPLPVKSLAIASNIESPPKLKKNTIVLNKVKNIEAKQPVKTTTTTTIIKKRHSLESLIDFCNKLEIFGINKIKFFFFSLSLSLF